MGEPTRTLSPFTLKSLTFKQLSADPSIDAKLVALEVKETVEYFLGYLSKRAFCLKMYKIRHTTTSTAQFQPTDEPGSWSLEHCYGDLLCGTLGEPCLFMSPEGSIFAYQRAKSSDVWVCTSSPEVWKQFPLKELMQALESRAQDVTKRVSNLFGEADHNLRTVMSWFHD